MSFRKFCLSQSAALQLDHLHRRNCGATLIELMIASGIMATAFVMVMGGIVSIHEANNATENRTRASTMVESVLEEIQALNHTQLLAYQPPTIPGLGTSSTIQVACVDGNGSQVILPAAQSSLTAPLPNPVEVRVTVVWSDHRGRLSSTIASTLSRR